METQLIAPILGQFTGCYLFGSPLREVYQQRKNGKLVIDCVPFPVTLVQHLVVIVLGTMLNDWWIGVPNMLGAIATMYHITSCLRYHPDEKMKAKVEVMVVAGIPLCGLVTMAILTPQIVQDAGLRYKMIDYLTLVICTMMYGAPCLEAFQAVRQKDASRLSLPLSMAGAVNGCLWGSYGMATGVISIMIPNSIGSVLSTINIIIKLRYHARPTKDAVAEPGKEALPDCLKLQEVTEQVPAKDQPGNADANMMSELAEV